MVDPNEIEALKASIRGVRRSADDLRDLAARVDALDPHAEIDEKDLDELNRRTLAHAIAAQALRGFVQTMLRRRGRLQEAAPIAASGEDE